MGFLAQILSAGDMFNASGSKGSASNPTDDDDDDVKVQLRGWKWIKICGQASTKLSKP